MFTVYVKRERIYDFFSQIDDFMWAEVSIEVFFLIDTLYIIITSSYMYLNLNDLNQGNDAKV